MSGFSICRACARCVFADRPTVVSHAEPQSTQRFLGCRGSLFVELALDACLHIGRLGCFTQRVLRCRLSIRRACARCVSADRPTEVSHAEPQSTQRVWGGGKVLRRWAAALRRTNNYVCAPDAQSARARSEPYAKSYVFSSFFCLPGLCPDITFCRAKWDSPGEAVPGPLQVPKKRTAGQ